LVKKKFDGLRKKTLPKISWSDLALIGVCLIWGINFSVIKLSLVYFDPLAFNAVRFPLAALVLLLMLRANGPIPMPRPEHYISIILLGILGNVIYQLLFIYGIEKTLAGNSSLILATVPVWTLILATILNKERHGIAVWSGITITLLGIFFVISGSEKHLALNESLPVGDLLVLLSAITWALYTVGSQNLAREYGALPVTAWTLCIATPIVSAAGLRSLISMDLGNVPIVSWIGVAYAGVFALAISYYFWNYSLEKIGAPRTAAFSNLVPVFALSTALVLLGEIPSIAQIIGTGIILIGLWITRQGKSAPKIT
jgi:drug/metabolite transporter (DMT)-like permease